MRMSSKAFSIGVRTGILSKYISDSAFVTGKGSPASEGDQYWNTVSHNVREHNGTAWQNGASGASPELHTFIMMVQTPQYYINEVSYTIRGRIKLDFSKIPSSATAIFHLYGGAGSGGNVYYKLRNITDSADLISEQIFPTPSLQIDSNTFTIPSGVKEIGFQIKNDQDPSVSFIMRAAFIELYD